MPQTVPVSSKLPDVGVSIFAVMTRLANEHGAINLSQGFPDFDCDPALVDAVARGDARGAQPVRADARRARAARGDRRQGAGVLRRELRSADRDSDRLRRDGWALRHADGVRRSPATR